MAGPCYPAEIPDFRLSDEEKGAVLKYARDTYMSGKDIGHPVDIIHNVAKDLGLRPEWVSRAFVERPIQRATNEVYKRAADKRAVLREAQTTVRGLDLPTYQKVIGGILKAPFATAVFGHGTVGMETHAGGRMFLPSQWDHYWKNTVRQWPLWLSKSFHERAIQELTHDPLYVTAKRAGLEVDIDHTPKSDYEMYSKWSSSLGSFASKVSAAGARGFDALKIYRLESFKHEIERTPESIRSDPQTFAEYQKKIAKLTNQATGAMDIGHGVPQSILNATLFAPKLVFSRWARVVYDPVKTLDTFANWKGASAADRQVAIVKARNAAQFAATYVGAMIANQALLTAAGSKQAVNFTDPSRSDWLKFKGFGRNIALDGGLLDPIRLIGQIVVKDLVGKRNPMDRGTRFEAAAGTVGKYVRGKFSPTLGIISDELTGSDFMGRPVPRPLLPTEKPRFKDQPAYTPTEYALGKGPIPLTGPIKEIYDEMRHSGMQAGQTTSFLRSIREHYAGYATESVFGMTGAHESKDYQEGKPVKTLDEAMRGWVKKHR